MANNESKGFYKLSWLTRIGFGAGDMAQNLIYQTISIWLLFFYTNVFGLDPGIVFEKVVVDYGGYTAQFLFGEESARTRVDF